MTTHQLVDDLKDALESGDGEAVLEACRACMAADEDDGIDCTSLPVAGPEPESTEQVWTWTHTHLVRGTCSDDLELEARP